MTHDEKVFRIFVRLREIFGLDGYELKIMRRITDEEGRGILNLKKSHRLASINLKTKIITLDIFTTRFRKPKAIKSILRILAHEIAHSQKLPFRQLYRRRWINRQHFPEFYEQVKKNVERMMGDEYLVQFIKE